METTVDLVLRVKAGVESAALSLDEPHMARAILERVDDDLMRLHSLLDRTPSPPVQGLTEDNVAAILSTLFLTGVRKACDATVLGEACECSTPSSRELMRAAEERFRDGKRMNGLATITASFLAENGDPEAWRMAARALLGTPASDLRAPWQCAACNHEHRGSALANICVGCACPHTAPQ
jgi:hypothetical protein